MRASRSTRPFGHGSPGRAGAWLAVLGAAVACGPTLPDTDEPASPAPRIVVMAPAAAEMLEALGMLPDVVAIGEYGPWPGALAGLPQAGGYSTPNPEQVLALDAGWVVTTASEAAGPAHRQLERLGVHVLALDTSTYEGIFSSLEQIGRTFGRAERAREVAAALRARLAAIEQRARGLAPRRVLFVVGRDPLFVAGPGSHVDRLLRMVGGENVAGDALSPYQQMSLEIVLERRPEVIIDTSDNRPDAPRGPLAGIWARWPFLPAVRDGRVYQVAPERLVIPGLHLDDTAELLGRLIHPERFGEPSFADPARKRP